MDTPAVPKDDVSGMSLNLLPLASSVVEPLHLLLVEVVAVPLGPAAFGRLVLVCLEELGVQRERSLENHQTTVVRSILVEVHDTLDAVLESSERALVHMWPWLSVDIGVLVEGEGDVDTVDRD